ncbi:MAG: YbjN domain-containing protein [Verrucomicrobiota bacterium]|nr:YbjN domain-containing protein [Verrucomicrobiota bacterium]
MQTPMETVLEIFREAELDFTLSDDNLRVYSRTAGDNGEWGFVVVICEERDMWFVMSSIPIRCPKGRRNRCAELLTRINNELSAGSFSMDMDLGEISFRVCYPLVEGQVDPDAFRVFLGFVRACTDRFTPAILSVMYGSVTPKQALAGALRHRNAKKPRKRAKPTGLQQRFLNN